MAGESLSLLEFLRELLTNTQLRDQFAHDPQAALAEYGLDDLSPDDVHDALVLAEDNQTADFSRDYAAGHQVSWTPPPVAHDASPHDAVQYLNSYVLNNHVDFDQDIDVHSVVASGDGSVAAGGDISHSTITTGDHNQVGDGDVAGHGNVVGGGNGVVTGHDDTTAFGAGDATGTTVGGDVHVGDGGAFASGGSAAVDDSDNSWHDVGNSATVASVDDSYQDHSDHGVHHSGDVDVDASTHDSDNRSSSTDVDGSHNTTIEHH